MNYIIENLAREFRGRDDEIYTLTSLIGDPRDASPPSIFIYGPSATGKTAIIKRLINEYNRQFPCPSITALDEHGCDQRLEGDTAGSWFAYVDCVECNTPRLVFERALNRWAGWQPSESNRYTSIAKCESSVDFVNRINQIAKCTPARASGVWEGDATRYLVLDHAERIRDLGPLFLSALARLNELVSEASATADARGQCSATYRGGGGSVCTIMISQVVWDKFRPRHGGAPDPLMVRFEDYSKQVVLDIVAQDCPQDEPLEFFLTFVDAVYEVFHRNCVNLNELRHLVALLYPRYVEPVYEGQ
ncbi:Origin recognition complex subunit 5, partial [Spiromyces aspiralis]